MRKLVQEETAEGTGVLCVLGGDGSWSLAAGLRLAGLAVADTEPPPKQIAPELAARYGFGLASVRAGALGDTRLLLQLVEAALAGEAPPDAIWTDAEGRFHDALRPGVEPGSDSREEVAANLAAHMAALGRALAEADLLVLPLRPCALVQVGAKGTILPAPMPGLKPPKGCKTSPLVTDAAALDHAFEALLTRLRGLRPGIRLRLVPPPAGIEAHSPAAPRTPGLLHHLAGLWAARFEGVYSDPLTGDLCARLAARGDDAQAAAALARLFAAADPVAALSADAPAPSAAVADKRDRKARKGERQRRKKREGGDARVVCEDELLEAFS